MEILPEVLWSVKKRWLSSQRKLNHRFHATLKLSWRPTRRRSSLLTTDRCSGLNPPRPNLRPLSLLQWLRIVSTKNIQLQQLNLRTDLRWWSNGVTRLSRKCTHVAKKNPFECFRALQFSTRSKQQKTGNLRLRLARALKFVCKLVINCHLVN